MLFFCGLAFMAPVRRTQSRSSIIEGITATTSERSFALMILDRLRANLLKATFADLVYSTDISNTQARVFDEYFRRETPSLELLASLLNLNKSTISRAFESFQQKGLVRISRSPVDQRKTILNMTEKGRRFLKLQRDDIERKTSAASGNLSAAELEEFKRFMTVFAGGSDFSALARTPEESELTMLFRKLTYAHGVITGDYLQSGFSASEWVLLSEIHYGRRPAVVIMKLLNIPQSTLSQRLRELTRKKLLVSKTGARDKRSRVLELTEQGRAALQTIEKNAETTFNFALRSLNAEEKTRFLALLTRYVGPHPGSKFTSSGDSARVKPFSLRTVRNDDELVTLRRAFVKYLAHKPSYPLTGTLLSSSNTVLKILSAKKPMLAGAVELAPFGFGVMKVINCFIISRPEKISKKQLADLLTHECQPKTIDWDLWDSFF